MTAADRYPRYRAPRTNRQVLCVPPWSTLSPKILSPNNTRFALDNSTIEISGRPLTELAREARQTLLADAHNYTQSYVDTAALIVDENRPLVMTGHQPELVHPGVWLKNFAASQLAAHVGGTAVSLVIDNDLCRIPAVRVPTGTAQQPRVVDVPFDQTLTAMPYEQRGIADPATWNSFGERATQMIAPLVPNPLLSPWWQEVVEASQRTSKLGLAIAQARHRLEHRWGNHSLEVPQSQVCQSKPFLCFMSHLLLHAARLRQDYNLALEQYRQFHRLRSAAQPLPNLTEVEGWIETPFWIWTDQTPERRPLFAQPISSGLLLSDRHAWQQTVTAADLPEQLAKLSHQGIKLRTRALLTTLYARLLIADTFIHGIGGAKYDQVTNLLCQKFFDVELPELVALSGTLHLPIEQTATPAWGINELRQELRALRYHPEQHLQTLGLDSSDQKTVDTWVLQKKQWVKTAKTPANASHRHRKIVAANQALQPWLESRRKKTEAQLATTLTQIRANQLLESREYPFCLFPQELSKNFFLDFSRKMP